jgi:hypothetical protein
VKQFAASKRDDLLASVQNIQHDRFVKTKEFLIETTSLFILFEFMPLSTAEIMRHPLINELRLASILGQVDTFFVLNFPG